MSAISPIETVVGGLLVFVLPGLAVSRALFPEWPLTGPLALRRWVELLTLAFVLSVVLTVLVGYFLLVGAPGGFRAAWSDPVLEEALAAITVVAVVFGYFRGAYRRGPPVPTRAVPPAPEEGAFELTRRLDRLNREERRIRHALRTGTKDEGERHRLAARLEELRAEGADLARQREAEYAE